MKNKKKLIISILACIDIILCSQNVFASSVENVMLKNTGILEYTDNPYMPFYTTSHINENRIANKISSLFRSAVRATLPKQYRTEGLTVKDQKNTGECLAFAYTSAIEAYNIVHT